MHIVGRLLRMSRRLVSVLVLALVVAGLAPLGMAQAAEPGGRSGALLAGSIPTSSTDTGFPANSLIIDMGATTPTAGNSLKPYGFVYELLTTYKIPVSWTIKNNKTAMGAPDFTATGLTDVGTNAAVASKTFAGGSFVVSGDFAAEIPAARLTYWTGQGVKIYRTSGPLTLPQFSVLKSWPRIVLDADSGAVADDYYKAAGIPATAYRMALPSALTACDDLFVFPHADPTWSLHHNLIDFNQSGGFIFGQCHAASVLENIDDPGDAGTEPDMNFLSTTGLVPYGSHQDGTPPYTYNSDWSDPVEQITAPIDAATQNGSEQIYLPKLTGGWRPTTKIMAWDPDQANLPGGSKTLLSNGPAAVEAYGRGFGNPNNGLVMYQAGHTFAGTSTAQVSAQRTFMNFNLLAGIERAVNVTSTVPSGPLASGQTVPVSASASGGSGVYTYKWTSSCGGTFANDTAASTTFTAPTTSSATSCALRVTVTDSCGRVAFDAKTFTVNPPPPPAPSMSLVKKVTDASGDGIAQLGETLTYSFTVTNTGNVAISNVTVSDPKLGLSGAACTASLAVGETKPCSTTKTYVVTAADIGTGQVSNTATVTGTPSSGGTVTATDTETISAPATPAIKLAKSVSDANGDGVAQLGETLTYTFTVTNTGNVPLTNVDITDAKLGMSHVACVSSLAVGETKTCPVKTYVVTAADINDGVVANTATAEGSYGATKVNDTASRSIPAPAVPGLQLTKSVSDANGDHTGQLGETLTYTFTVKNTGNVPLTNVTITDPKLGLSNVACVSSLAVGATATCPSQTYVVTAADIGNGSVVNTATGSGTTPSGGTVTSTDSATIPSPATPAIKLTKSVSDADHDGMGQLGETLTYTFKVKNTGNVPLTNVTITDAKLGLSNAPCGVGTLAVGAEATCTVPATYVVTASDVTAGSVSNTATAKGSPPSGSDVSGTDSATMPTQSNSPAISVVKSVSDANGDGVGQLGETLTYTFTVKNTGNVPLTDVRLTDPKLGLSNVQCVASLAVGAQSSCPLIAPQTYTVTAADIAAGSTANTVTVTATPSTGGSVTSTHTVTTPTPAQPMIVVNKSVSDANGDGLGQLGETLTYTFKVTNTGNVPLTNVTITDAKLGMSNVPCVANLAVGATATCPLKTYTVTAADIDNGAVNNTATAKATPPGGGTVSGTDSATIAAPAVPAIKLVKKVTDANGDGIGQLGEVLTYSFTVTNLGNVPLSNVTISDAMLGLTNAPCVASLAVGASTTCPLLSPAPTHTVSASDIDNGQVANTATAKGTYGSTTVNAGDAASIPAPATSGLNLVKTVSDANGDGAAEVGEVLTYGFKVVNTGNVPLTNVTISDAMLGLTNAPCVASLPVGATSTCPDLSPAPTYTVTAADASNGEVSNTATAKGKNPANDTVTATDSATITVPSVASIKIVKAVDDANGDGIAQQGELLTYSFIVTNTGNVTLTQVKLNDPLLGLSNASCVATLAPGATTTCPLLSPAPTYTVTATDVANGQVSNTVTVKGKDPSANTVTGQDTVVICTPPPAPGQASVSIQKSVDMSQAAPGDTVTYTLVVRNTGDADATGVTVTDHLPSGTTFVSASAPCTQSGGTVTCSLGSLAAGDSKTLTIKVTVNAVPSAGGDTSHQHQLDYTKVETNMSVFEGTETATATCPTGYFATDGSVRIDHVDQDAGTYADAVVLESHATNSGSGWTGTIRNDTLGQVQAKVNVVCMSKQTTSGEDHSHHVVVSDPVTTSHTFGVGREEVDLTCPSGTYAVTPGFTFTSGDGVVGTRKTSTGWTFIVDTSAPATAQFEVRCLSASLGTTAGHSHDLLFTQKTATVEVPAGGVAEAKLDCPDGYKGIVAWYDMDPGLVSLGTDPQPISRVFRFFNPTDEDLTARIGLLCVSIRTNGGQGSSGPVTITNTASVTTTSSDANPNDNSDSASFQVTATGVQVAPNASISGSGNRTMVTVSVVASGSRSVMFKLVAVGKVRGTHLKSGSLLASGKTTVRRGHGKVRLVASKAAAQALRSGRVHQAKLVIVAKNGRHDVRTIKLRH